MFKAISYYVKIKMSSKDIEITTSKRLQNEDIFSKCTKFVRHVRFTHIIVEKEEQIVFGRC